MEINKIEKFCEEKNCSLYQLALRVGIQPSQLYRYMSGEQKNISVEVAFRIADALEVDINEFRKE